MEEPRPVRRIVYVEDSPPARSPPTSFVAPPPATYSPRHSSYQPSPRTTFNDKVPSPPPAKLSHRNEMSLPAPTRKQQTIQPPATFPSPIKPNIPKTEEPPLRLMDIIAQNRAKRGSRIPKPKREVDEEKVYDPPTYRKNFIKNGFIVHK